LGVVLFGLELGKKEERREMVAGGERALKAFSICPGVECVAGGE
jgi:hypothetical protein